MDDAVFADLRAAQRIARRHMRFAQRHAWLRRRQNRAGHALALEWVGLITGTYVVAYSDLPWLWKAVLCIPWGIFSSLSLSNIEHYASHWPLFRSRWANVAWRWSGAFIFASPLEYRFPHVEHHRLNNSADDPITTLATPTMHSTVWEFVLKGAMLYPWNSLPWAPIPACVQALKIKNPLLYREILQVRWFQLLLAIALLSLDFFDTVLFFFPITLLIAPLASNLMSLTDHVPGNPTHPFQMATYLEPKSNWQRMLCRINHHTAATHLTHHLFPQVHWMMLPRLQRRLAPIFVRYGAPQSIVCNSLFLGNPFQLVLVSIRANRQRAVNPEG